MSAAFIYAVNPKHEKILVKVIQYKTINFQLMWAQSWISSSLTLREQKRSIKLLFGVYYRTVMLGVLLLWSLSVYSIVNKYNLPTFIRRPYKEAHAVRDNYCYIFPYKAVQKPFLSMKQKWLLSLGQWMSIFYDSSAKEMSLQHTPTQTTYTHTTHSYTHTHGKDLTALDAYIHYRLPNNSPLQANKGYLCKSCKNLSHLQLCVSSSEQKERKKHVQREIKESIKEREIVKRERD